MNEFYEMTLHQLKLCPNHLKWIIEDMSVNYAYNLKVFFRFFFSLTQRNETKNTKIRIQWSINDKKQSKEEGKWQNNPCSNLIEFKLQDFRTDHLLFGELKLVIAEGPTRYAHVQYREKIVVCSASRMGINEYWNWLSFGNNNEHDTANSRWFVDWP